MTIWVFDCEGDSLSPTKFHCLSTSNPQTKTISTTSNYDNMRKFLTNAKVLIGHNIQRWDIPNLERVLGIKIKAKLVDTLAVSWYLYPERKTSHGLDSWGQDLGVQKPEIIDWENQTQEEYEHRCREDVKINVLLWNQMYRDLMDIYGSDKEIWKLLDYLEFKMHAAMLKEKSQWKLDIEYVQNALNELTKLQEDKRSALIKAMPPVPSISYKSKPKRFINKDGSYSKLGMDWIKLLSDRGLHINHEDDLEIVNGYEEGNPGSTDQMKNWLYSLGWIPITFKYVKNKDTGDIRNIPQINLEHGKGICDSIKLLYPKEPNLELLDGLSVLSHRIGILKGFLRDQEDGWIKAQIRGLTNTLRVQHTTVVNLPKVDKLYASSIRGALIAQEGYELCGSDLSSLEDKIKQSFIYPFDKEYVDSVNQEGFDPHLTIALLAGMLTQEQVDAYKSGNMKYKPIRDIAKNGNYACQYNAGPPRLVLTCGINLEAAKALHKAYWEMNSGIKKVVAAQKYKGVNGQLWLYNPISELWYSLRYERDIFSTLIQGTGAYVFDLWLKFVLEEREQLTADFHDEMVLCIKKGNRKQASDLLERSIQKVNDKLKLNTQLSIGTQFGDRYSQIH